MLVGTVRLPAADDADVFTILDEAVGYAYVYNVEMAERRASEAECLSQTSQTRARASWARAFAYINYCADYYSDRYADAFCREYAKLTRLDPNLCSKMLCGKAITRTFCRTTGPATNQPRDDLVRFYAYGGGITACEPIMLPVPSEPNRLEEALALYNASEQCKLSDTTASSELSDAAAARFGRFHELHPDDLEIADYLCASLIRSKRFDEAIKVARQTSDLCPDGPDRYTDKSAVNLPIACMSWVYPEGAYAQLCALLDSGTTDPWVLLSYGSMGEQLRGDERAAESVTEWERIVKMLEAPTSGANGAWFGARLEGAMHLAKAQYAARRYSEALVTLERVSAVSPDYGNVRLLRGLALQRLARGKSSTEEKVALLKQAASEFRKQMEHNYGGTTAANAIKGFAEVGEALRNLEEGRK